MGAEKNTPNLQDDKLKVLEETITEVKQENDNLRAQITELKKALPTSKNQSSTDPVTVKIDGANRTFKFPKFRFEDKDYLASDAAADKDLCERLFSEVPGLFK